MAPRRTPSIRLWTTAARSCDCSSAGRGGCQVRLCIITTVRAATASALNSVRGVTYFGTCCRPAQCLLPVCRTLTDRPMHDLGGGRMLVPLLQPVADELPFAVALELHTCCDGDASAAEPVSNSQAEDSSFQLHYVLQGQAQVGLDVYAQRVRCCPAYLQGCALEAIKQSIAADQRGRPAHS